MIDYPTLAETDIAAITGAAHGDPFAVLGPHAYENGVVIRVFEPHAEEIVVVVPPKTRRGKKVLSVPMERIHPAGLFEAFLPDRTLPVTYRLAITAGDGHSYEREDPYRFPPTLSDYDQYLMAEGSHAHVYERLGAHLAELDGVAGVRFAVWAPNAMRVSVIGDFNQWDGRRHPMRFHVNSGVWELFVPGLGVGALYKYEVKMAGSGHAIAKSDPVGFFSEMRPNTASIVWDLATYQWNDAPWMERREQKSFEHSAMSVYEVHLGSWRTKNGWEWLNYPELTEELVPYVKEMGYTHIELLPISEFPYDGSWGYQVTGYFAATSRYGTPEEFMAFIDACHQAGLGVILDWVPAHFPKDQHGLAFFDGTYLYEHADPRRGQQPDWGTLVFNYGRNEVRQFLISNALFWLDKYHIDGLRVDAVASMIYLDFSREEGEWIPNRYGGRENLEAIDFLRRFNDRIHGMFPGALTIAEESTSWPGVTQDTADGGLGFDLKWNMGWMHDTLRYASADPIYRSFHHGSLTFSMLYAFSERFLLPFSHDEVVHLKRSMLDKMPGDVWQRFANLRAIYAYQYAHPGKKLLFMGGEFGQWREWSEARSLDWALLEQDERHKKLQDLVRALNGLYREQRALHEEDFSWQGFTWLDFHDGRNSVISFARHTAGKEETIVVVCNFTPVVRHDYPIPVLEPGRYHELLNTDADEFGGSGVRNEAPLESQASTWFEHPYLITATLPPLAVVFFQHTPFAASEEE